MEDNLTSYSDALIPFSHSDAIFLNSSLLQEGLYNLFAIILEISFEIFEE